MERDNNKPLWQLTVGELVEIVEETINHKLKDRKKPVSTTPEYVYGINGLAEILNCSKTHAQALKSKGVFDKAIIQNGRKIIIDKAKALECFKKCSYE